MSIEEKVERYKKTELKCPICQKAKLDYIPQEPSPRLDYECLNPDCRAHIFFDESCDQWFVICAHQTPEPKIWEE